MAFEHPLQLAASLENNDRVTERNAANRYRRLWRRGKVLLENWDIVPRVLIEMPILVAIIERIDAITALEAFTGQFQQHCIITNPGDIVLDGFCEIGVRGRLSFSKPRPSAINSGQGKGALTG